MKTEHIPFLDLVTVHRELREEFRAVFEATLDTAGFIGGPMVPGVRARLRRIVRD
jgi:hypothetical protein